MPVYLNYLASLEDESVYVSSGSIAAALGYGEVMVRKDLAYTNCTGRPKVGYVRTELIAALEEYLCCNVKDNAVTVGVGMLGRAILGYGGFARYGVHMVAAFDNDENKIGTTVSDKPVYGMDDIVGKVKEYGATLAVIAVPAGAAQSVADKLVEAGVKGILNFAPVQIRAGEKVKVIDMDVAANLAVLASSIQ